ncbi:hypothetical protein [Paracoccus sp. 22332]|uniref:hypothetical protein n=1 Tax=Paracoccus sp. 22332 TaxID=3453913 RepID=UPI003F8336C5
MGDKPILFSGPMVRAILEGRKTQTRRVLKPVKGLTLGDLQDEGEREGNTIHCARHQVQDPSFARGDRLWVREAWRAGRGYDGASIRDIAPWSRIWWEADEANVNAGKLRPSIHMPRWASRLTLTVTDVRVQRLQDISEDDAVAEGAPVAAHQYTPGARMCETDKSWRTVTPRLWFHELWDRLNAKRGFGWDANPWVCAVTFTAYQRNIDQMEAPDA